MFVLVGIESGTGSGSLTNSLPITFSSCWIILEDFLLILGSISPIK